MASTSEAKSSPPLRADAQRNRDAILTAARQVFAEQGLQASLDEIASRAGVGNATLYRRFPDRYQLVAAVFAAQMAEYAEHAAAALEEQDSWRGFSGFVTFLCRCQAQDEGISELLTTRLFDTDDELARHRRAVLEHLDQLLARARSDGALRPDFTHQDLVLLLMGNAGVVRRTRGHAPSAWERHLAFVLAGIRAPGEDPAPSAPPAPTVAQVEAAMRSTGPPC
jgi:AcrR family transcriptional regulator